MKKKRKTSALSANKKNEMKKTEGKHCLRRM